MAGSSNLSPLQIETIKKALDNRFATPDEEELDGRSVRSLLKRGVFCRARDGTLMFGNSYETRLRVGDTKGHVWEEDEGFINTFAYSNGVHCNGPCCVMCGYGYCQHCNPDGPPADCPKSR